MVAVEARQPGEGGSGRREIEEGKGSDGGVCVCSRGHVFLDARAYVLAIHVVVSVCPGKAFAARAYALAAVEWISC